MLKRLHFRQKLPKRDDLVKGLPEELWRYEVPLIRITYTYIYMCVSNLWVRLIETRLQKLRPTDKGVPSLSSTHGMKRVHQKPHSLNGTSLTYLECAPRHSGLSRDRSAQWTTA